MSVAEPLFDAPVSLGVELGNAGVVGLVFVSSAEGVSDGEVRARCIELVSSVERPWPDFLLCFLLFLWTVVLLVASSDGVALFELSLPMPVEVEAPPVEGVALEDVSRVEWLESSGSLLFAVEVSLLGVVFALGLLLGSEVLLLAVFDEVPGSALLF